MSKEVQLLNFFTPMEEQIKEYEKMKEEEKKRKEEIEKAKANNNNISNNVKNKNTSNKKKEKPFEGTRIVKVYGNVVFEEKNPKVTEEEIRKKLVEEYEFGELQSGETTFKLVKISEEKAYLLVNPIFNKKG